MKLADLNRAPTYQTTLPHSKKNITFRPFTVAEQRTLLQVQEDGDAASITATLVKLLNTCVEGISVENINPVDFEWLLVQLRIRSVGAQLKLRVKCTSCEKINIHEASLSDAHMVGTEAKDSNVDLLNGLILVMKTPTMVDLQAAGDSKEMQLAACFKQIVDGENVFNVNDYSAEERKAFVDSLNQPQLMAIEKWLATAPRLELDLELGCQHCGAEIKRTVKGLMDFLA